MTSLIHLTLNCETQLCSRVRFAVTLYRGENHVATQEPCGCRFGIVENIICEFRLPQQIHYPVRIASIDCFHAPELPAPISQQAKRQRNLGSMHNLRDLSWCLQLQRSAPPSNVPPRQHSEPARYLRPGIVFRLMIMHRYGSFATRTTAAANDLQL